MSESGFDIGLDDASQAGVYEVDAADLPALAAAARDSGLLVRLIDLDGCRDKQTLLLRIATVLEEISAGNVGMVRIGAEEWRAVAADNEPIPAGTQVTVREIKGTRAVVEPVD